MNNQQRDQWVEDFHTNNPLSPHLIKYGLGQIEPCLVGISEDFQQFNLMRQFLQSSYGDLKKQVLDNTNKLIASYEEQRQALLKPWTDKRDADIGKAEQGRDQILRDNPDPTSEKHKQALEVFNTVQKLYSDDYTKGVAPIHHYSDGKIKEAKQGCEESLKYLLGQEGVQMSNNYGIARELLTNAELAWNGQPYPRMNFHWQIPQPSAPPAPMFAYPGSHQRMP